MFVSASSALRFHSTELCASSSTEWCNKPQPYSRHNLVLLDFFYYSSLAATDPLSPLGQRRKSHNRIGEPPFLKFYCS